MCRCCNENSTTDLTDKSPPCKKRTLGSLLKNQETDEPDTRVVISPEQKVKQEMQRYLVEPKVDEEEDPLKWWKHKQTTYPLLSGVAKKYLCITATSAPSERLFSRSGRIVTPLRSSLKPETVQKMVFLSMNF